MGKLSGKRAIITGGGSGIGLAIAERFVAEGAEVVLVGRRRDRLEAAVAALGSRASAVSADVSDDAQVRAMLQPFDRIDLLVTCAGDAVFGPVDLLPLAAWRTLFAGRFFGQLAACHFAVPKMPPGSAIVLCSGIAGRIGLPDYAGGAALCGAVNAMGRALAVELAPRGIRVNVLSPGLVEGTAIESNLSGEAVAGLIETLKGRVPLGRSGTPAEMGDAALFLATCAYATGMILDVDGGWTA